MREQRGKDSRKHVEQDRKKDKRRRNDEGSEKGVKSISKQERGEKCAMRSQEERRRELVGGQKWRSGFESEEEGRNEGVKEKMRERIKK